MSDKHSFDNHRPTRTPLRLVGIAFVVDQKGRGARMVLRYPSASPSSSADTNDDDIFFRLGTRQMAKLFRPKPPLCEHPMTLAVGQTIFCCRAILMDRQPHPPQSSQQQARSHSANSSNSQLDEYPDTFDAPNTSPNSSNDVLNPNTAQDDSDHDDNNPDNAPTVELFSVVVALAPHQQGAIPVTGWFEQEEWPNQANNKDDGVNSDQETEDGSNNNPTSPSFQTVRRVHVSLARLCRVLEREERRCRYVSVQSSRYGQLRKQLRQLRATSGVSASPTTANSTTPQHIRRTSTFSSIFERDSQTQGPSVPQQPVSPSRVDQVADLEQEILEIFMAGGGGNEEDDLDEDSSSRKPFTGRNLQHHGNLARELVQFHDALGRNDTTTFQPSPSLLLTGSDGIVHVNGHIAIAVEAVAPRIIQEQEVRPYETLLFPHATPKELLKSLAGYGSSSSRRLQQVLLTVNPQKSLIDIAADANLSLQSSMEIAKYLVSKSAAIVAPVISRNCRFACNDVEQLHRVQLPFAHEFGAGLSVFALVSFLTQSAWTLEEATRHLMTSRDPVTVRLRAQVSTVALLILAKENPEGAEATIISGAGLSSDLGVGREQERVLSMEDLEDCLFQLTVWLCSHRAMVHLLEYMVSDSTASSWRKGDGSREEKSSDKDMTTDEAIFQQIRDLNCLSGTVSLSACSWRLGIDLPRLRAFVERHPLIRIVRRPFEPGDDWGRLFD